MDNKAYLAGTKHGAYIVRNLRRLFAWWPPRTAARRRAFLYREGKIEYYKCEVCKNEDFIRKDTAVDHIIPVVGPSGILSWDEYINRLFCGLDNLQVICKPCHKEKTNAENTERRGIKRDRAKSIIGTGVGKEVKFTGSGEIPEGSRGTGALTRKSKSAKVRQRKTRPKSSKPRASRATSKSKNVRREEVC